MASERHGIERRDQLVDGPPGIRLFVRSLRAGEQRSRLPWVLLVHGARVPGLASFDLDVPGGSLAADLARAGHPVAVMDVRGYGGSTRPREMSVDPALSVPLVRISEAIHDIHAVVGWLRAWEPGRPVAALGWATGGQWLGGYAALHRDALSHLVLLNALYGGGNEHPSIGPGSDLEDPAHPGAFNDATGAWRFNTAASLAGGWDRSIPLEDKDRWRDPAVLAAYQAAALASDPTSAERDPPSFRAPSGALEDSFALASGRQLWDASLLRCATLVVRGGRDFWSREVDVATLALHARGRARRVEVLRLPDATHFVHLDRPERGRDALLASVLRFVAEGV